MPAPTTAAAELELRDVTVTFGGLTALATSTSRCAPARCTA